ncbi:Os07g0646875 [Oryza sativa Japonica Group]|uniref:Os07g0646875 protein n=1 Tax=Oryza sativa subsp. japonica TaxID=39947 RepID=A0A0P0X9I3_ORYSJ|nr:Os07g0646875 [Oryza sativa Japonica Group]
MATSTRPPSAAADPLAGGHPSPFLNAGASRNAGNGDADGSRMTLTRIPDTPPSTSRSATEVVTTSESEGDKDQIRPAVEAETAVGGAIPGPRPA